VDTLGAAQYALVTSYRRDGRAVPTPVWIVRDGDAIALWTPTKSGKVKRIRRRGEVLVGACDFRGTLLGDQVPATAAILDADGTARVRGLLARKYGLIGRLTMLGSRIRRGSAGTVAIRITLARRPATGRQSY
jgi:PPOX class probable F420-dependent enzyme